jgi:hypothetical protein
MFRFCQLSRAGRLQTSGEIREFGSIDDGDVISNGMHGRAAAHVQQIDGCTRAGREGRYNRRGGLHLDMSYPRGETVFTIVSQKALLPA